MSANLLLIESDPTAVDRVRGALAGRGHRLEVAATLDAAVNACAHFEPRLVVLTSELPRVSVADAITQLRGRAGLRSTPFLILMSDYRGTDSREDARRLGAQDILPRSFQAADLVGRVDALLRAASEILTTQAVPQETLDALRRSAGGGRESYSSADLFADILSDVEKESAAPRRDERTQRRDVDVDRALADVLGGVAKDKPAPRPSADSDVDALLSQTLSGLEIKRAAAGKTAAARPETPPPAATSPPATAKAPAARAPAEPPAPAPPARGGGAEPAPKKVRGEVAPPVPSGTTFGQYVLEEHIATGGMAQVYKARMLGLEGFQKTVAVKRILPHLTDNEEFVRMFVDEAKLAAQLSHPNIIHIYDLGKIDRSHFIAMEYIEGRDLRSILDLCRERGSQVPVPIALWITTLLAGALDYAHKKRDFDNRDLGLVHRDVSPQNVLISSDGEIKLCDFGIAKAASKASHTRAGALKGKLQYMSPEQAWGRDIDHRSDVFSLGLVLYEMLTARKVFAGDSELSILEQVRSPKVEPPSRLVAAIPADVDRVVLKALTPERTERYQSARDLQRDCEAILKQQGWEPDTAALVGFIAGLESGAATPSEGPRPAPAPAAAEPGAVAAAEPPVEPPPMPPVEPPAAQPPADEPSSRRGPWLWLALAVLAVIAAAAGWWFLLGPGAAADGPEGGAAAVPPAVVVPEPTPSPTPATEEGLLDEAELLERAREVAAEEMARQEEALRDRLEKEFPTPTPLPPTATATETPTETPVPSPTPTPIPPTPTRVPPTPTPIPPTATPAVTEGEIVSAGPGVTPPVLLHKVDPEYPPIARRAGLAGDVVARLLVGTDGRVEDVEIVEVSQPGVGFERATEEAVRQWRYRPATKHGVKVRVWVQIKVSLTLS